MTKLSPGTSFGAKASEYRQNARSQNETASTLAGILSGTSINFGGLWLDIGSGPAILHDYFFKNHPDITPILLDISEKMLQEASQYGTAICADMDQLPFQDQCFTGVTASSSLQWSKNLPYLLHEIKRLLTPGGTAALALFTENTLPELRTAQKKFGIQVPVTFPAHEAVCRLITDAGLTVKKELQTEYSEYFNTGFEALRAISRIGAGFREGGALKPSELRRFAAYYESLFAKEPANSYSVSFFIASRD